MKKTALLALLGLVAVQSTSFRKFAPADEDLFSLKSIGDSIAHAADNVGNAVGQAATSVGDAVGQGAQAVGQAATTTGNAVGQAATNVGDAVGQGAQAVGQAATAVGNAVGQAGQAVGNAAVTVGNAVGQAGQAVGTVATSAYDVVANDFANGAGFGPAVADWKNVNMNNATSILEALQATAVGCSTFFNDLNDLTGGALNSEDLDAASAVATAVFPPAAVVIDGAKVIMNVGTDSEDITPLIQGITTGIQTKDYLLVIVDAFQIFKMLYQIIA